MNAMQSLEIKVEAVGEKAVLANGVWYNIGKKAGCGIGDFVKGQFYKVEVSDSAFKGKTYHFINSMTPSGTAVEPRKPVQDQTRPSLPPTEVSTSYKLSVKDIAIIAQNSASNALGSPLLASLAMTKQESEIPELVRQYAELSYQFVMDKVASQGGEI